MYAHPQFVSSVELWCTEKEGEGGEGEGWVPATNTVDAQQQLDSVQSQYDLLLDTHDSLIAGYDESHSALETQCTCV